MFSSCVTRKLMLVTILSVVLNSSSPFAAPGRWEKDLTGENWQLWLDKEAEWKNDTVFMPPVDMSNVPVNLPTCGWNSLSTIGEKVKVPGTVEEYHWADLEDYLGVSWWSTTFNLDPSMQCKKFTLKFDSVVLRAEVFVNQKLVGYDVIGNSPFDMDISDAVRFDGVNRLDIRITDPGGNFNWSNNDWFAWGEHRVPATHGFGGITGNIYLRATDDVCIDDLYIQNKPEFTDVEAFVTLKNTSGTGQKGQVTLSISEWKNPTGIIWKKTVNATVPSDGSVISIKASVPDAKLWNLHDPNLYVAKATFTASGNQIVDSDTQRFGFRWFSVKKIDGDEMFFMNDKRIFILSPMSRGYWGKNGMFPTPEMLKKNMDLLQEFGFTMCLMNQAIGRPEVIEACDEIGMVSYEELGGYRCSDEPDEQAMVWRREKARRMAIRDRSNASLIIYVMKCETDTPPSDDDKNNMMMIHDLDPVRLITYNSDCNREKRDILNDVPDPFKMHMRPGETELEYYGWWNQHHWVRIPVYLDKYWKNPRFYLRGNLKEGNTDSLPQLNKDEIIYLGEEGNFGSQVRVQKIKEYLDLTGATGWREQEYIDSFNVYDQFLDKSGYRKYFPTVDKLTMALGVNTLYFHGRILENFRTGNIFDGINIHCWDDGGSAPAFGDLYRNPVADPAIFSYYTQPLYVAVKLRTKVNQAGGTSIADIFIVNELDLKGKHTLEVKLYDPDGTVTFTKNFNVNIIGGTQFGQLLIEGLQLPVLDKPGYYNLRARILDGTEAKADGYDDIFVVDYMKGAGLQGKWAVIDDSGVINAFLKETRGITLPQYKAGEVYDNIIVAQDTDSNLTGQIMKMVENGACVFVFSGADAWANSLDKKAITLLGKPQRSGRYFVGGGRFMQGLPVSQSMNWEYQEFYNTRSTSCIYMDHLNTELIVAGNGTRTRNNSITAALTRIPVDKGQVFLSTLPFLEKLPLDIPVAAVPKKFFLNLLEYGQSN